MAEVGLLLPCLSAVSKTLTGNSPHAASIHILDNDSLLNIFYLYRPVLILDEHEDEVDESVHLAGGRTWVSEQWWYRLAHVCQRWRDLILRSASYLGLSLVCTYGTPVADMLAHSPHLPLIIDYFVHSPPLPLDYSGDDDDVSHITEEEEKGIIFALKQRDRVCRVRLRVPIPKLQNLVKVIDEEYPILEYLILSPLTDEGITFVLSERLQAPRLIHLMLFSFALPKGYRLLTTAAGLVTLWLFMCDPSAYFQPIVLLRLISFMPQLETLKIDFQHAEEDAESSEEDVESADEDVESADEDVESADEDVESADEDVESADEDVESADEDVESADEDVESADEDVESADEDVESADEDVESAEEDVENQLTQTLITLPNLRWFDFCGSVPYLQPLVCDIIAPRLEKLKIFFQPRLVFFVTGLSDFMITTENLRFDSAEFVFSREVVHAGFYLRAKAGTGIYAISIRIYCARAFFSQVASITQIFFNVGQRFSAVERLILEDKENGWLFKSKIGDQRKDWHKLLRSFSNVKTLHIDDGLVETLSHCLRLEDGEYPPELLSELQELSYSGSVDANGEALTPFIDARQSAGRPVNLVHDPNS